MIYFTNGNMTKYVYSCAGEKLRTVHYTAVPNITRTMGEHQELTDAQILYADSTDYLLGGALTLKNGRIDMYLFEGGYYKANATSSTSTEALAFYYYNKDHQGNIREVLDSNGRVLQFTNYYPFGTPYCSNGAYQAMNLQPYKYNGKELDRMHGLNTYDYGARQYNPVVPAWDRMDPLCEKYYGVSPYAYCLNNPVNAVDPDGKKVWVFATKLPGSVNVYPLTEATHTFTVVKTSDGKFHRFSYGPIHDNILLTLSGTSPIVQRTYADDQKAQNDFFNNKDNKNIKGVIEVNVPEGMSSNDFDQAVLNSAKEFEGNREIKYNITAAGENKGNCNSSTTSLLKNAGTSDTEIKRIGNNIPGIKWGFGSSKPWTKEERNRINFEQIQYSKLYESLMNVIGL